MILGNLDYKQVNPIDKKKKTLRKFLTNVIFLGLGWQCTPLSTLYYENVQICSKIEIVLP